MTKYQLTLVAEKLKRVSAMRLGNPYAVVKVSGGDREGEELGRTEALDTLDPRWARPIYVETTPDCVLPISVEVFDHNGEKEHRIMAKTEVNFEVTAIFQSQVHSQQEELKGGTIIRATVVESVQGSLTGFSWLHFRLLDVKNIEGGILGLGRTDPFLEIQKKNFDPDAGVANWIVAHRTEHVQDNLNPVFKPSQIPGEDLCYGDSEWPLRIVLYDWQKGGKHREMGAVEVTFAILQEKLAGDGNADRRNALELRDGNESVAGLLIVLRAEIA